jgi:hypothetical protein
MTVCYSPVISRPLPPKPGSVDAFQEEPLVPVVPVLPKL